MSAPPPGSTDGPPARDPGTQTVKAVVVTLVAVLAAVLILHHHGSKASAAGKSSATTPKTTTTLNVVGSTTTSTTVALVSPSSIRLQVLNGVLTGSYSGEWSTKLHASPGYNTLAPDNATAKVTSSSIYIITAGYLPEAEALAKTVGLPDSVIVNPPPPSSAPIPSSILGDCDLVLVIGPNLVASA